MTNDAGLLLTAFEPFDGSGLNSSQEALREFLRRHGAHLPVVAATLPVVYERDVEAAWAVAESCRARAILHLGQTGRELVEVERLGVNLKLTNFAEMVAGAPPRHEMILPDAPPAYFATAPVDALVAALQSAGVPAAGSAHAGAYLCNHLLFRSLHRAATQELRPEPPIPVGFLHLPRLPVQHAAGLPLAMLVRAVEVAVEVMLRAPGEEF